MSDDNQDPEIILPDGQELSLKSETARTRERKSEDKRYVPVIIKRNDDDIRHPDDILRKAIHEGCQQYNRSRLSLFISAIAAGLILGFAGMSVAIAEQLSVNSSDPILKRFLTAAFYPMGFIICIMSGTQLFTEHTALAVYPVLDKKKPLGYLFVILTIILTGNIAGTFVSSFLITSANAVTQAKAGYVAIAEHLLHYSASTTLISSILAGWLMAQGSWLVMSTSQNSSRIVFIYIVTFIIGIGGLHHSIVGSAEVFSYFFVDSSVKIIDIIKFLLVTTFGNFLGGSVFVATLNYAHVKHTEIKH
jgi:formate/nitrite transporter FocA (FNT family)